MRLRPQKRLYSFENGFETDVQEATLPHDLKNTFLSLKTKKIAKYIPLKPQQQKLTFSYKIMRFPMRASKKTLRVICFQEEDLNWPKRFTRKLKEAVNMQLIKQMDNDQESTDELIAQQIQKGYQGLKEAIKQIRSQPMLKTQQIPSYRH